MTFPKISDQVECRAVKPVTPPEVLGSKPTKSRGNNSSSNAKQDNAKAVPSDYVRFCAHLSWSGIRSRIKPTTVWQADGQVDQFHHFAD
jgi:hypothetical protein